MFDRLSRKARKTGAPRPDRYAALDVQWTPAKSGPAQTRAERSGQIPPQRSAEPPRATNASEAQYSDPPETDQPEPSLSDRIRGLWINAGDNDSYVASDEPPDYLHGIDPDPEPSGDEWGEPPGEEEFVINAAGMKQIEENLGTYLSVIGMTAEMIDGYCGRVFAQNLDEMVKRWSKVIAHYPKAANLFLDSKGGIIMQWMAAIQATWPVLYAIYEHHLAHTVVTGTKIRAEKVDATMPPMQDQFTYTAR